MPKRLHASLYSDNKDWYDKGEGSEHMKRQIAEAGEPTKLQVDYTFEKMQNEIGRLTTENERLKDKVDLVAKKAKKQMCELCADWPVPTDCDKYPCWRITIVEKALKENDG